MGGATMRAIVVDEPGPPEVLQSRELPRPEPGPGQVRLRVAFVGMNPVDALVRRERLDWMPVRYPFTPGLEHTGVVDAVGPDVDGAWLGRRVLSRTSFGGYADWSLAPVRGLLQVPEGISLRDGCIWRGCTYTAWHALHRCARLQRGERLLVHSAAGAVGLMALQVAREASASVVGLCGGPAKVEWVRSFGFDAVVDYLDAGWPALAQAAVPGGAFDVILDGNGGPQAAHNHALVAPLGRVLYLGAMAGASPPPVPVGMLIDKSFSVGGMTLRQVEVAPGSEADLAMIAAIREGRWRLPVGDVVPLAEVAALHRRLEARALRGRAVIEVGGEAVR
ncbi:MAG: zinc-binding alcohol dehydrogenase family protein [Steroidobacteraceae bacterium]|jgi:NADPH2:quinone reductase|nr:zinc-binding alcohol dehydrogenase family protein [Steroidobacteraceae bacterium]